MHDFITGSSKDGDQCSIPIDMVQNYGVFDGSVEALKDLIMSVTYIAPMTWTTHKTKKDTTKVLFFKNSKAYLIDHEVECKPKNADVKVSEGDAWVIFHGNTEDEDGDEMLQFGFAIVDRDTIKKLMLNDIMQGDGQVVAVGMDKNGNVKSVLDEDEIDPVFARYAVEHFVDSL